MKKALFPVLACAVMLIALVPGCSIMEEENKSPIAVFTASPPGTNVGETITFSAAESKDKDGKIVKYSWDFGDGEFALGVEVEHTYDDGGDYIVSLVVKDDSGAVDKANTTIHVNEWPVAEGRATKDPAKIHEDVLFDGSFSSDKDGKIVCFEWDFGDDTSLVEGKSPTHRFSKVGEFNITLTVTDDKGAADTSSFKIFVEMREYKVLWEERSRRLDTLSDYTNENETTNQTYEVDYANVTRIEFNMTWADHIPVVGAANDEFFLLVESPDGKVKKLQTTTELISHVFEIDTIPETLRMEAEEETDVEEFIFHEYTSDKGNGDWSISVGCIDAGDWYLDQFDVDNGNDWDIEIVAYYYTATITEIG